MFGSAIFAGMPVSTVAPPSSDPVFTGSKVIQLVEDRANEITVPDVRDSGVLTRSMEWDDATNRFVAATLPTRISEFVKQINKRVLGSSGLNPNVVQRVTAVDADTGNQFVFTPGATPVGSLNDFQIVIPDQLGGYESRGFLLFLAPNANPGTVDGGQVLMRLLPSAFPWA